MKSPSLKHQYDGALLLHRKDESIDGTTYSGWRVRSSDGSERWMGDVQVARDNRTLATFADKGEQPEDGGLGVLLKQYSYDGCSQPGDVFEIVKVGGLLRFQGERGWDGVHVAENYAPLDRAIYEAAQQQDGETVERVGVDLAKGKDRTVISFRCPKCGTNQEVKATAPYRCLNGCLTDEAKQPTPTLCDDGRRARDAFCCAHGDCPNDLALREEIEAWDLHAVWLVEHAPVSAEVRAREDAAGKSQRAAQMAFLRPHFKRGGR